MVRFGLLVVITGPNKKKLINLAEKAAQLDNKATQKAGGGRGEDKLSVMICPAGGDKNCKTVLCLRFSF
ncbi:hypothetical protein [Thalassomonas haliotis]|uniref:Uncharacterized protein n=1 Tax=Thalassomonas haliotis TaxID=485448 RepID=A0ABY7VL16_9GAMM|nr:hypothetical protein [Thalassomonas haliotis]WDE13690.1 hypothetical protein H3N35_09790 [Thalassomonas haliotis]